MADNVVLNSGSGGDTAAADEILGIKYQRVKITLGADGVNDGDLASGNKMPVDLGTDNDVTVQGEDAENAAASANPVQVGGRYDATPRTLGDGDVGAFALDADGALHISDGGNSITIDGSVTETNSTAILADTASMDTSLSTLASVDFATQTTLAAINTKLTGGTVIGDVNLGDTDNAVLDAIASSVATIDNANATIGTTDIIRVAIFDDANSQITTFGGGTQYAGDAALGTTPTGTVAIAQRDDALTTLTPVEGDAVPLRVGSTGALWVDINSVPTGNAEKVDDAAFTLASDSVVMMGAIRDDSLSTLTAVEGDAVPFRVSSTGALHVTGAGGGTQYTVDDAGPTVVTMAGVVRDDSLTTLTEVDGDATVLRVSSTGALHVTGGGGGTEYTEDETTANPIVGTASLMERDDALTTVTPVEGDWIGLRGTAEGALWVQDFNSDAILADTANMDTNLTTIAGAVSGTEMQVDIVAVTPDLALGTDISNVFGTSSLILATQADNVVNTSDGLQTSSFGYVFDGTTWDRARGDSTNGMLVNLGANNDVTVTGTVTVDLGANNDVTVTSISAGSNLIGDVGLSGTRTSGGTTLYRNVDADETEDAVKASAGQLYWIHAMNLTAAVLYLQLYNAVTGSVTVGTTTPDLTFPIPTQGDTNGAGFVLAIPNGIAFSTAITVACTTTVGGASGPAANGCIVNMGYA